MGSRLLMPVIAASLVGCASGFAEVGPANEDYAAVTILTEMPEGADQIGLVRASSDSGSNQQQRRDHAAEELRRRAANAGANAVVLTDSGTASQTIFLDSNGGAPMPMTMKVEIVEGIAINIE